MKKITGVFLTIAALWLALGGGVWFPFGGALPGADGSAGAGFGVSGWGAAYGQVVSDQVVAGQATSGQVTSGQVTSGQITSGQITTDQDASGQNASDQHASDQPASGQTASPSRPLAAIPRGWSLVPDLPEPRSHVAAAALGPQVYVIGGADLLDVRADVDVFDTVQGEWLTQTPLPGARARAGAVVYGGRLYVIGGFDGDNAPMDSVLVLTGQGGPREYWSEAAPLPQPRAGHLVLRAGHYIYALAGTAPGIDRYDVETAEWQRLEAPDAMARMGAAGAVVGQSLYVVGGVVDGAPTGRLDIYDSATKTWSRGPDLPVALAGHGAVTVNGEIHVLGGRDGAGNVVDHHYVLSKGRWVSIDKLPRPRSNFSAVARSDGAMMVLGGATGGGFLGPFTAIAAVDLWNGAQ